MRFGVVIPSCHRSCRVSWTDVLWLDPTHVSPPRAMTKQSPPRFVMVLLLAADMAFAWALSIRRVTSARAAEPAGCGKGEVSTALPKPEMRRDRELFE